MRLNQKMPRPQLRGAALCAIATLFAAMAGGCGSGESASDGAQPASSSAPASPAASRPVGTPAAAPTPARTAPPAATAPPAETATPEPTASPSPTAVRAPVELTFDQADSWDGTMTPPSKGPLGIVYAQSNIAYYLATPNRLHTWAAVYVGVNEHPAATAWLFNRFTAPGQGSAPVAARISTAVNWKGTLAGNGAAGTWAGVRITLSVLEANRVLATKLVHALERRESVLTAGGFRDSGRKDIEMEVSLIPGHEYELRLTAKCEAGSGAIGVATSCLYGSKTAIDDGYVDWSARTIVFAP